MVGLRILLPPAIQATTPMYIHVHVSITHVHMYIHVHVLTHTVHVHVHTVLYAYRHTHHTNNSCIAETGSPGSAMQLFCWKLLSN